MTGKETRLTPTQRCARTSNGTCIALIEQVNRVPCLLLDARTAVVGDSVRFACLETLITAGDSAIVSDASTNRLSERVASGRHV